MNVDRSILGEIACVAGVTGTVVAISEPEPGSGDVPRIVLATNSGPRTFRMIEGQWWPSSRWEPSDGAPTGAPAQIGTFMRPNGERRAVVPLGGSEYVLNESQATTLRDALTAWLGDSDHAVQIDPSDLRIVLTHGPDIEAGWDADEDRRHALAKSLATLDDARMERLAAFVGDLLGDPAAPIKAVIEVNADHVREALR